MGLYTTFVARGPPWRRPTGRHREAVRTGGRRAFYKGTQRRTEERTVSRLCPPRNQRRRGSLKLPVFGQSVRVEDFDFLAGDTNQAGPFQGTQGAA